MRTLLGLLSRRRRAPATLTVVAEPDAALLASAAALRRLGARITRYDTDDASIEARLGEESIRIVATSATDTTSRLTIESSGSARAFVRRFRAELQRPAPEVSR